MGQTKDMHSYDLMMTGYEGMLNEYRNDEKNLYFSSLF